MRISRVAVLACVTCVACAGSGSPSPPPKAPPRAAPAPEARARTTLSRREVLAVVEQGLGRFLQKVALEPAFADDRFLGFRVVALRPASFWANVDLKPGDVVLKVNGLPIERETQAYDAFQTLRTAPELRVEYLREGQPGSLVYRIEDGPG